MIQYLKNHKITAWFVALLLGCGIVIAAIDTLGQANEQTSAVGLNGLETEQLQFDMALASVPSQAEAPSVDWATDTKFRKQLKASTAEFEKLLTKAKSENAANGAVSAETRDAGLASAQNFKKISDEYVEFCKANNFNTLAKQTEAGAKARLANADMAFNAIDSDKIAAYQEAADASQAIYKENMDNLKSSLTAEQRSELRSALLPRAQKLAEQGKSLISSITNLISQAKDAVSGDLGGLASCGSADSPLTLVNALTSLLDLIKSFVSNATGFVSDLTSL